MKKVAAFPTKEEIKAARAVMRKVQAARMKEYHTIRRRRANTHDRELYMWTHDMRVVLASSAREVSVTPVEIARRATVAADSMAAFIAERKPKVGDQAIQRRSRGLPVVRWWWIWQEMFDTMIHEMAAKSELAPHVIVDRACKIADAAMPLIKRRYRR